MPSTAFLVMLMLPSFAFAFLVLATFYGAVRAYVALSWMPAALYVVIYVLQQLSKYQPSAISWPEILQAVAWTGLVQCALGAALAARAALRGQGYAGLLAAACLAVVPYLLRARI
jgi:hypothetical protein